MSYKIINGNSYYGGKPSPELKKLSTHFTEHTGIQPLGIMEERNCFHWKRLIFQSLNCEQMEAIAKYIKKTFSKTGIYTHLSPRVGVCDGHLCLTVDAAQVKEFIM